MPAIIAVLAEFVACAFWILIAALIGGRLTLLALKLKGESETAKRWSQTFNHYTAYLRP
jgi:prolipoprotein diacylglyceryltransferase